MGGVHHDWADASRLVVTTHAAGRWAMRVRGDDRLPEADAERDLVRCAEVAELAEEAPAWLLVEEGQYPGSQYLMLGDDVAIVVVPLRQSRRWAVTTVVTRTDTGSVQVARRRSARHMRLMQERESSPRRMRSDFRRRKIEPFDEYDD